MIVDSSAMVAVLWDESDAARLYSTLGAADTARMSAATYLETSIVVDNAGDPVASNELDVLLDRMRIKLAPMTASQARIARRAYQQFGKGSGHRAQLNFGDCFAYALAKELDEPLLFKGDDFIHTDVRVALAPGE